MRSSIRFANVFPSFHNALRAAHLAAAQKKITLTYEDARSFPFQNKLHTM
jgi:hypothetical protein